MDNINFENGLHLSLELCKFLQNEFTEPLNAIFKDFGNCVFSGMEWKTDEGGMYISDGYAYVDGEIIRFDKQYLDGYTTEEIDSLRCSKVVESESVDKKDGTIVENALEKKYLRIGKTGQWGFWDILNNRVRFNTDNELMPDVLADAKVNTQINNLYDASNPYVLKSRETYINTSEPGMYHPHFTNAKKGYKIYYRNCTNLSVGSSSYDIGGRSGSTTSSCAPGEMCAYVFDGTDWKKMIMTE